MNRKKIAIEAGLVLVLSSGIAMSAEVANALTPSVGSQSAPVGDASPPVGTASAPTADDPELSTDG